MPYIEVDVDLSDFSDDAIEGEYKLRQLHSGEDAPWREEMLQCWHLINMGRDDVAFPRLYTALCDLFGFVPLRNFKETSHVQSLPHVPSAPADHLGGHTVRSVDSGAADDAAQCREEALG